TSGIYLFGLHLKILNEAVNIGKLMLTEFNKKISEAYNSDDIPRLESLSYSVKKHTYEINYDDNDKIKKKQKTELMAKTFDKQNISRNSYRDLCAIEFYLPSEKLIYQERQAINKK
ncbi:22640_t:CDS:2, partial [Gigaspora rosea]